MIAVDWGTSSLRAYLLDASGAVLDQRRSSDGILACQGRFADVLSALIDGWDGPVLLSGMIGSRNGWVEQAYLPCPPTPLRWQRPCAATRTCCPAARCGSCPASAPASGAACPT